MLTNQSIDFKLEIESRSTKKVVRSMGAGPAASLIPFNQPKHGAECCHDDVQPLDEHNE
jgi:hypothetical protein